MSGCSVSGTGLTTLRSNQGQSSRMCDLTSIQHIPEPFLSFIGRPTVPITIWVPPMQGDLISLSWEHSYSKSPGTGIETVPFYGKKRGSHPANNYHFKTGPLPGHNPGRTISVRDERASMAKKKVFSLPLTILKIWNAGVIYPRIVLRMTARCGWPGSTSRILSSRRNSASTRTSVPLFIMRRLAWWNRCLMWLNRWDAHRISLWRISLAGWNRRKNQPGQNPGKRRLQKNPVLPRKILR